MTDQFWDEVDAAHKWAMAGDYNAAMDYFSSALIALGRIANQSPIQ